MDPEEEALQMQTEMQILREESPDPHKLLLASFRAKHYAAFKSLALRGLNKYPPSIDINHVFPYPLDKTFLDIACSEGLEDFVELLLELGSNPNKVNNAHNRAPIHFATEEGHAGVLDILLKDPSIKPNLEAGRQTALHVAVKQNDLACARVLLENNASPYVPNSKGITALHAAATSRNDAMVNLILSTAKCPPDIDTFKDFRQRTTRQVLEQELPHVLLPPEMGREVDANTLRYYLECNEEDKFLSSLRNMKTILTDDGELIQTAAKRNLCAAVKELIEREQGGSIPGLAAAAKNAVEAGNHEVLKELLYAGAKPGGHLLIAACKELGMSPRTGTHRMQCLKLLLSQPGVNLRCADDKGNTPLHYAARAESSEAVELLLKAESYIGHRNVLGVPPLAHISPKTLENYLDDCLQSSKERTDDYEIEFNYRCLMPHALDWDEDKELLLEKAGSGVGNRVSIEMEPLQYIANNSSLRHLLKHPILSSFLYLKWHRISPILYANFIFYVVFYILLNTYILSMNNEDSRPVNRTTVSNGMTMTVSNGIAMTVSNDITTTIIPSWKQEYDTLWALTGIALLLLALREMLQLLSSPIHYFCSLENWLELALVCLTVALLGGAGPQVGAVAILLSAWELVVLIGQHPRMSTGIEMFKTVSVNFMRFLFLYAFLILAFALSFYTLFKDGGDDNFPDPGHSLFKTIIMLTGEFDANDIPFLSHPGLSHLIFVLFVFLIAIVLFNLLNGLAVSDTAEILGKAELVGLISRARLIAYAECVLIGTPLFSNPQCCCNNAFNRSCKMNPLQFLAKKILFFPNFLPMGMLCVKPYRSNSIIPVNGRYVNKKHCFALSMDPNIIKQAKEILSTRGYVSENEKILTTLEEFSHRLTKFETMLDHINLALKNNNFNSNDKD